MSNFVEPIYDPEKLKALQNLPQVLGDPRYHLLTTFGFKVALRITDLLGLKVRDVRTDDGRIRDALRLIEGKTKKTRNIPLEYTRADLEHYFVSVYPEQEHYLFPGRDPLKPLCRQQVWRLLKKWAKEAGIDSNIGTHSFRKTFAYTAVAHQGVRLERVQKALNHSSPQITQVYAALTDEDALEAYAAQAKEE